MEEERQVLPAGVEPVEWLTRTLIVDSHGAIWARYLITVKGEEQTCWHRLPDIETAVWQHFHILENYLGQYVGMAARRSRVPGEKETIRRIADDLLKVARDYLRKPIAAAGPPAKIEAYIKEVLQTIGPVTNPFKQVASVRLQKIEEPGQGEVQRLTVAAEIIPAAGDLTERVKEILRKGQGIRVRLSRLHRKHRLCRNMLIGLYRQLAQIQSRDQKERLENWPREKIQGLARIFNPAKTSLLAGLHLVNVQPYLERVRSREIRALTGIPRYLESKEYDKARRAISRAIRKLERVVAEVDVRFRPEARFLPRTK